MRIIKSAILAVVLFGMPMAVRAAELPLGEIHHARVLHHSRVHFGYYWYQWGWRRGGTRSSWYGSSFAFVGR